MLPRGRARDGFSAARFFAAVFRETDSVVGRVFIGKPIRGLAANPRGNYLYACAYLGGVAVISDTTRVGLSASRGTGLTSPVRPALVRGALLIAEQAGATLLDIAGRRVMELKPGENDVRGVAPGVYFVSERLAVSGKL